MRGAAVEPDRAAVAGIAAAPGEEPVDAGPEAAAAEGGAAGPGAAGRDFVGRHENVLIFGNPGSGKTHVVCAIGQELIRSGRRVMFATCGLMVQDLLAAKRDLKLSGLLKKLSRYEVLILDDLGYVQQSREEMEVLFSLLAERYERGSVMLTSNLPFSGWESIFKDPMTTAAAIDRLVHHSVILELNVPSYRAEQAKKSRQTPPAIQQPKQGGMTESNRQRPSRAEEPRGTESKGLVHYPPSREF